MPSSRVCDGSFAGCLGTHLKAEERVNIRSGQVTQRYMIGWPRRFALPHGTALPAWPFIDLEGWAVMLRNCVARRSSCGMVSHCVVVAFLGYVTNLLKYLKHMNPGIRRI
jgi:hypothetical protein